MNHDAFRRPAANEGVREHLSRIASQLARTEDLLRAMDALPHPDWADRRDAFLSELAELGRRPCRG
jgi:hypothetical protein